MFSAFNPSKCTHTWSSGQPTLWRPGSSWGFGALLKGLTSVMNNSYRSRDSNPQAQVTSPTLYPLEPRLPTTIISVSKYSSLPSIFLFTTLRDYSLILSGIINELVFVYHYYTYLIIGVVSNFQIYSGTTGQHSYEFGI